MEQQIPEYSRQFQMLCDNKESFLAAAGFTLMNIGITRGVDTLINKHQWYAQICQCIIDGDTSSVTEIEKEEFVNMHLKLMGW